MASSTSQKKSGSGLNEVLGFLSLFTSTSLFRWAVCVCVCVCACTRVYEWVWMHTWALRDLHQILVFLDWGWGGENRTGAVGAESLRLWDPGPATPQGFWMQICLYLKTCWAPWWWRMGPRMGRWESRGALGGGSHGLPRSGSANRPD